MAQIWGAALILTAVWLLAHPLIPADWCEIRANFSSCRDARR